VLDDLDDNSGVYAIGKPPFDAKMDQPLAVKPAVDFSILVQLLILL